jgi:hypothetical protein
MKKTILILVSLAVLLSGCTLSVDSMENKEAENSEDAYNNKETENSIEYKSNRYNSSLFYNPKDFYSTVPENIDKKIDGVKGIVCTHHLLASEMLHEVFLKIDNIEKYKNVVIIGPDHNTTDTKNIYSTQLDWMTPFGKLEIDQDALEIALEYESIEIADSILENEHSNAALVHFVKYYMPDVKILNFTLPGTLDLGEVLDFSNFLEEVIIDDETLLIGSIDFSHYLDYDTANEKDDESFKEIQERNFVNIMNFNNDNVDSPQTLVAFLKVMNRLDGELAFINNKNSYDIIPFDRNETTSYFSLIYN